MENQTEVIRTAILQADAIKRARRNRFLMRLAARIALYGSAVFAFVLFLVALYIGFTPVTEARIADAKVQIRWYDVLRDARLDTKYFQVKDSAKLARR